MNKHDVSQQQTSKVPTELSATKIGILGAGQLGKMLAQAASQWQLPLYMLDRSDDFPAAQLCHQFVQGDFANYDDVYAFGQMADLITVEIEHVNTDALLQLEKEGKVVHPSPNVLNIIKDKGLQKQFYSSQKLPSAPFQLFANKATVLQAIDNQQLSLPFVQKTRTAGYDGRGVQVIRTDEQLDQIMDAPSVIEPLVNIKKEIAVQVARNAKGEVTAFPAVDMEFHPTANLVEFLSCPANISQELASSARQLAIRTIEAYQLCGLLSVELFLTQEDGWLINEVAPRPHNSGHHTIESLYTSQFQQHLRAILNWPLGSVAMKSPAVMVNLLGSPGCSGPARYEGLEACLEVEGAAIHIYGKALTKPYRKMGHATVLAARLEEARTKARFIQETLKIIA